MCSNCADSIRQDYFAGVALFLATSGSIGYFLNPPHNVDHLKILRKSFDGYFEEGDLETSEERIINPYLLVQIIGRMMRS